MGKLQLITKGLIKENPTFVLLLGMCPTLATTTSAVNGMSMGLATMFVLILSNMVISAIAAYIPDKVRIPSYIVVIATFVTLLQFVMQAYVPDIYETLGLFIPLIVVNCIVLGRAEAFASKNGVAASAIDGLCQGIGYTVALVITCVIRELLGNGTFGGGLLGPGGAGIRIIPEQFPAMQIVMPVGGFLVLGFVIAGSQALMQHLEKKNKKKEAAKGIEKHVIESDDTLRGIAQRYGVKLDRIYKMNSLDESYVPVEGDIIKLRD